jgi:hypothetical protein
MRLTPFKSHWIILRDYGPDKRSKYVCTHACCCKFAAGRCIGCTAVGADGAVVGLGSYWPGNAI